MKPTGRLEAAKAGMKKFFTGKPCRRGHVTERYTANGVCVTCEINRSAAVHAAVREARSEAKKNKPTTDGVPCGPNKGIAKGEVGL